MRVVDVRYYCRFAPRCAPHLPFLLPSSDLRNPSVVRVVRDLQVLAEDEPEVVVRHDERSSPDARDDPNYLDGLDVYIHLFIVASVVFYLLYRKIIGLIF